jgi:hypothetical protein
MLPAAKASLLTELGKTILSPANMLFVAIAVDACGSFPYFW